MKTIEQLLQDAQSANQDEWGYEDPHDACCGFPCTVDGCHESHPTGTYGVYGPSMEDHDLSRMKEVDAAHIVQWQPRNVTAFLKAFAAMREALLQIEGPQIHPEGDPMDDAAAIESMTIKAIQAGEVADAVLENL